MHALEGLVVLDLTRLLPGAVATQWLANFGAEIIKIEVPGTGDYARQLGPSTFAETNRRKLDNSGQPSDALSEGAD